MGRKIKVHQTESFMTYVVKEPIIIDFDDYPELEGMDNRGIIDYLENNSYEMKAQNENSYDSLSDELSDKDVIKDKIYNNEFSYIIDDFKE